MAGSSTHPSGLMEPLESGQSGKAMPAPMVVVRPHTVGRVSRQRRIAKGKEAIVGLGGEIVRVHNEEWLQNDLSVNYR